MAAPWRRMKGVVVLTYLFSPQENLSENRRGFLAATVLSINAVTIGVGLIRGPLFCALSDRVGRKPLLVTDNLLRALFAVPLFMLMQGAGATMVLACKVAFVFLMSFMVGGSTVYLAEAFPPHLRTSGMAISLNITTVLFGGILPLVSVWLTSTSGSSLAPACYLVVPASLTAVFVSRLSGLDSKPAVLSVPVVDG